MRTRYGDLPYRSFGPEAIEEIKAGFATQPRKANQIIGLFRILLGYAVKLRWLRDNPALRPEMLPIPSRTQVWAHVEEDAFLEVAPASLRLAIMLLTYTCQRPSDVLAMTTNRITERDGRMFILLRQEKTGALMELPLHRKLEPLVQERIPQATGCCWFQVRLVARGRTGTSLAHGTRLWRQPASPTGSVVISDEPAWSGWPKPALPCRRSPPSLDGASTTASALLIRTCRAEPRWRWVPLNCGRSHPGQTPRWCRWDWRTGGNGDQQGYANHYANCKLQTR
jgi:hypothetical protein